MFGLSYWMLPIVASCAWFGTLLAMLIVWLAQGRPHYVSMDQGQNIAYISDIGASGVKALFIAGSAVSVVVFDLAFISERWLRHKGRLARNTSRNQKGLSIAAVIFAIIGAAGLILLTIFDTRRHPRAHDVFLGVFILGYIISAIFICAEYGLLGYNKFVPMMESRQHKILRNSFYLKISFIVIEIILAIAFISMSVKSHYNTAAVLEWVVSLFYIFYQLSFVLDFLPALESRDPEHRFPTAAEMEERHNTANVSGGPAIAMHGRDSAASSAQPMYP